MQSQWLALTNTVLKIQLPLDQRGLDFFVKMRKAPISFIVAACLSVRLSLRMEQVGRISTIFDI